MSFIDESFYREVAEVLEFTADCDIEGCGGLALWEALLIRVMRVHQFSRLPSVFAFESNERVRECSRCGVADEDLAQLLQAAA